jgi:hypothetical protein
LRGNELILSPLPEIGKALDRFKDQGRRSLAICTGEHGDIAELIVREAGQRQVPHVLVRPDDIRPAAAAHDGVFIATADPPALSSVLTRLADATDLFVWAPRTRHFFQARPVFVQSIPKSGTHVLFEVLKAFGYAEPPNLDLPDFDADFENGVFYNLQHMPAACLAAPYHAMPRFLDALSSSVSLFIIRDPRDVAVSWAYYLASQVDYHISTALFREMGQDERLSRVITGRYPLPVYINRYLNLACNIGEFTKQYAVWWSDLMPNVWRLRFEDIIGPSGGGGAADQIRTIWGLQLALHVPGRPAEYSDRVFSKKALTFRRGQIGDFHHEFTPEHHRLFTQTSGPLLAQLGYEALAEAAAMDMESRCEPNGRFKGEIPSVAHEKHGGPLPRAHSSSVPNVHLVADTPQYNLLRVDGGWIAVAKSLGPTDMFVERLGERELSPYILHGKDLDEARDKALAAEVSSDAAADATRSPSQLTASERVLRWLARTKT